MDQAPGSGRTGAADAVRRARLQRRPLDAGARAGRNFTPERADSSVNVFEAVVAHVGALQASRKKVVIALWSEGSRDRMDSMLRDHKLSHLTSVNSWRTVLATPRNEAMLAVVGMESGFETDH